MLYAFTVFNLVLSAIGVVLPASGTIWYALLVSNLVLPAGAILLTVTAIALIRGDRTALALMLTWVALIAAVGLSSMSRELNDTMLDRGQEVTIARSDTVMGPHAGLGMEFALGQSIALDFEARYTGYIGMDPLDDTLAGAFSTNAGLLFHF